MIRLNRFIASATALSRRQADSFIKRGDISVNGQIIKDLGTRIGPTDQVRLNGELLNPLKKVYYVLNKPVGTVCSNLRQSKQKIVTDLVPPFPPVFTVGRLDKDTSGLLILTNDGNLAQQLTHPSYQQEKEYQVTIDKKLKTKDSVRLLQGVKIAEHIMKFDSLSNFNLTTYQVILHQGYNRQIRKMFNYLGYQVLALNRIRIGKFILKDLPVGHYLNLSTKDVNKYFSKV